MCCRAVWPLQVGGMLNARDGDTATTAMCLTELFGARLDFLNAAHRNVDTQYRRVIPLECSKVPLVRADEKGSGCESRTVAPL